MELRPLRETSVLRKNLFFSCICQKNVVILQRKIKCSTHMGTLLDNKSKEPKTKKGNRLYEFKRVQSDELLQYRIPSYSYLA